MVKYRLLALFQRFEFLVIAVFLFDVAIVGFHLLHNAIGYIMKPIGFNATVEISTFVQRSVIKDTFNLYLCKLLALLCRKAFIIHLIR
ncbi:hypothetical protein D3C81_1981820 [compost metagenome]